jgi:protein-tyrosine phosphatase
MIDLHTHILPGIDDGSPDSGISVEMMEMMIAQNVDTVVATPHYYCLDCSPAEHAEKAKGAYRRFLEAWQETHGEDARLPEMRFGAEIYLVNSLENVSDPELLKISGSDLMLFELPFSGFHGWMPRLVDLVAGKAGGRPVFAHIDRYLGMLRSGDLEELEEVPRAAFQFNSDAFKNRKALKYMYSLIKRGKTVFWASDCHGARHRAPDLGETLPELKKAVSKKFSSEIFDAIEERQYSLLGKDRQI